MDGEAAEGSDGPAIAAVARALEIPIPTIRSWERRSAALCISCLDAGSLLSARGVRYGGGPPTPTRRPP